MSLSIVNTLIRSISQVSVISFRHFDRYIGNSDSDAILQLLQGVWKSDISNTATGSNHRVAKSDEPAGQFTSLFREINCSRKGFLKKVIETLALSAVALSQNTKCPVPNFVC